MNKSFPCSGCGACCSRIKAAVDNHIEELGFPYKYDEEGRCEMLSKDNKCLVYNNRPDICNIEIMRKRYGISKERYYEMTAEVCNKIMDEGNVDLKYRIKL